MAAAASTPTTMPAIAPPDKEEPLDVLTGALLVVAALEVVVVPVLIGVDVVAVVAGGVVEVVLEGVVPLITTSYERMCDPARWLAHGQGLHV